MAFGVAPPPGIARSSSASEAPVGNGFGTAIPAISSPSVDPGLRMIRPLVDTVEGVPSGDVPSPGILSLSAMKAMLPTPPLTSVLVLIEIEPVGPA